MIPSAVADDVPGPVLGLHVNFADVLADHPEADQLHAGHKTDDAGGGGPARHRCPYQRLDDRPHDPEKAHGRHQHPEPGDEPDRLDRQTRDAVKGQPQHLGQGIVAFPGDPLVPLIGHHRALEAHQRHHAPQVEVDFPELGELLQGAGAHQPVVGVVVHHLGPHGVEQLVEPFGGEPLEKGVAGAAAAHAVDDLAAVPVGVHHPVHGVDVVLAVAVDGDGDVAAVLGFHQPGQHGVLVAPVAALADADIVRVACGQAADDLPGPVLRPVVDKQHPAVGADFAGGGQVGDLFQKQRRSDGQYLLLVVAGDDDVQNGCFFMNHIGQLSDPNIDTALSIPKLLLKQIKAKTERDTVRGIQTIKGKALAPIT